MILSTVACVMVMMQPKPALLWKPLPGIRQLVDADRGSEVAAWLEDGTVVRLSELGSVIRRDVVPRGFAPLRSTVEGLEVYPRQYEFSNGSKLFVEPRQVFAQHGCKIEVRKGVTVQASVGVFSRPSFDSWSGIAVSKSEDSICLMSLPMNVPLLTHYRFNSAEWSLARAVITPEVERLGLVTIIPRFNDLLFVNDRKVVYLGGFLNDQGLSSQQTSLLEKRIRLKEPPVALDDSKSKNSFFCLFVTDIVSRQTEPIIKCTLGSSTERGGHRTGRLVLSSDNKWLYILTREGIARIKTESFM